MVCPVKQINASFQQMEIFLFKNISTRLDEFLQIVSSNLHKRLKQFVQKYVKTSCHRTSAVLSKFPFLTRTLIPYWYIQIPQVPQIPLSPPLEQNCTIFSPKFGLLPFEHTFQNGHNRNIVFSVKKYNIALCTFPHSTVCIKVDDTFSVIEKEPKTAKKKKETKRKKGKNKNKKLKATANKRKKKKQSHYEFATLSNLLKLKTSKR